MRRSERHVRCEVYNPEVAVYELPCVFQKHTCGHKRVSLKRFHVVTLQICRGTALWKFAETVGELRLGKTTRELASTRMFSVFLSALSLSWNVAGASVLFRQR